MSLSLLNSYESDSSEDDQPPHLVNTTEPPNETKKKPTINKSHQQEKHALSNIPPDLARELKAAGRDTSEINILDFDPTPISNQPHPSSHIPQQALRNNAMRLARHITKESVTSVARRKHQITALAAEAVALQVAQDSLPGAARPGSRINGKFK